MVGNKFELDMNTSLAAYSASCLEHREDTGLRFK